MTQLEYILHTQKIDKDSVLVLRDICELASDVAGIENRKIECSRGKEECINCVSRTFIYLNKKVEMGEK